MAKYVNKVVYGGETLIDISKDNTVTAETLLSGSKGWGSDGAPVIGTCTYDSDTKDATAKAAEILSGKTAYVNGTKITGSMANNGSVTRNITTVAQSVAIPVGYHDGSGSVSIATTEQAKLIPENIRENVTILGVVGTMSGSESENPQDDKVVSPNVTKTSSPKIVTPDEGYTCLRQVTVNSVPYNESENAAGGITVTIG